jgi:hypothetical protein
MTHFLKFYGCSNILMSEVSSFLETLKEFFSEEYVDNDKIMLHFFK